MFQLDEKDIRYFYWIIPKVKSFNLLLYSIKQCLPPAFSLDEIQLELFTESATRKRGVCRLPLCILLFFSSLTYKNINWETSLKISNFFFNTSVIYMPQIPQKTDKTFFSCFWCFLLENCIKWLRNESICSHKGL